MTAIAEFEDFSFRYPHMKEDIIKNASFFIKEGTLTLLYGLSGSGKSTLCYALTGLIPWSVRGFFKGNVKIFGKTTKDVKPNQFAGKVGYLMQNPDSQFATLTVEDELVFAAENISIPQKEIESRFSFIVNLLELQEYLDRNVTQLSSGEKQRVVLGSILMMEPKLLILDEPLSFLDFPNRLRLLKFLKKIRSSYSNLTVIIAEHRINEVISLADNFLEIKRGSITSTSPILNNIEKNLPSQSPFSYRKMVKHYGFNQSKNKTQTLQSSILRFENVCFNYTQDRGKFEQKVANVLLNISFEVYPHEKIAIVGPNGIGKTTLLYLVAGILTPSNGTVYFHNQDVTDISYGKYSKNIGLIFQNPESQLLKNTIHKEIEFGPRNFNVIVTKEQYHQFAQFIFPSSLQDPEFLLQLHPFNLSWGEKRRLNLSSLFAYSPSVFLFDEPYTGQDYVARKRLMQNIQSISTNGGVCLFSSHDEEIVPSCDRVFLLDERGFTIFEKLQENKT